MARLDLDQVRAWKRYGCRGEFRDDVGNFRWLIVAPPGQEEVVIVLMAIRGKPMFGSEAAARVTDLDCGFRDPSGNRFRLT